MIIDNNNMHQSPETAQVGLGENPPPYEPTPNQPQFNYDGKSAPPPASDSPNAKPSTPLLTPQAPMMIAGPSYIPQHEAGSCSPTVYHYVNPTTGEHVTSLLPPDHPEMVCLQEGGHVTETKFGLIGVLAAIFWFPIGIGLCLLDRRVRCARCGVILEDGMCGI